MGFSTKAVHAGIEPDPSTGAIMTPIHLTSTYVQEELGKHKGYEYSRVSNPTRTVLENNIAALENGRYGFAFASGLAAEAAVFHLLKSGDEIVLSRNIYGGTYRLATKVLSDYSLRFKFVDTTDLHALQSALSPDTKMVFIETPTNPTMEITDIGAVAKLCRKSKLISVVDNTFATPYLQNPLDLGIDIVVHSATKYLNGHSDMIGGLAVTSDSKLAERLKFIQKSVGAVMSPFDCWMCLRGIKTLALRMARHDLNAMEIAAYLSTHRKVKQVYYPGLVSHPQHLLAAKQMRGFGGMIAFDLGSLKNVKKFLKALRLCALAESLGGVETLIAYPYTMSHGSVPPEEKLRSGITEGLLRLSVGIEDCEDIMDDLKQAMGNV